MTRALGRPQKGARKLDVDGAPWHWLVGSGLNVVLWGPDGTKHRTTVSAIRGTDPSTVERGQRKGTSDGMLTPEQVRQHIRTLA